MTLHLRRLHTPILLLACACGDSTGGNDTDGSGGIGTLNELTTTGGDDLDGSSTATMGSSDTGFQCGESQFVLEVNPTRIMLVLDKSGSMVSNTWDHDDDPSTDEVTRWSSLHATVDLATSAFDGSIDYGMLLYPSLEATSTYDANACVVANAPEVPVAPQNATAIMNALPPANATNAIQGGTPSATAVSVALEELRGFDASLPRAILFITDGEANCRADAGVVTQLFEVYDDTLHTLVEDAWTAEGIPTYVVGIAIRDEILPVAVDGTPDGINPHEQLNLLAEQGGRPQQGGDALYYAATNQLELEAALSEIAAEQFDCVVDLVPEPEHPTFVKIEINGVEYPRLADCAAGDGWVYSNPDGPYDTIVLCGAACDTLATTGMLDAIYECPPSG
jgi:hypothetical protein